MYVVSLKFIKGPFTPHPRRVVIKNKPIKILIKFIVRIMGNYAHNCTD